MSESNGPSIGVILEQLKKANGESASRRAKIREYRAQLDTLGAELESLRAEKAAYAEKIAAAEAERDAARSRLETAPDEWRDKYEEATAAIRARDHRDAFRELAADPSLKIKKSVTIDKLMSILGYKAESDAPDPAAIRTLIDAARATDPFLFDEDPPAPDGANAAGRPASPPVLPAGPNASRGAADGNASGVFVATRANMRDPEWMRENQSRIVAAQREGRFRYEP